MQPTILNSEKNMELWHKSAASSSDDDELFFDVCQEKKSKSNHSKYAERKETVTVEKLSPTAKSKSSFFSKRHKRYADSDY